MPVCITHTLILIQETEPALGAGLQVHATILKDSGGKNGEFSVSGNSARLNQGEIILCVTNSSDNITALEFWSFFHFSELHVHIDYLCKKKINKK